MSNDKDKEKDKPVSTPSYGVYKGADKIRQQEMEKSGVDKYMSRANSMKNQTTQQKNSEMANNKTATQKFWDDRKKNTV